VQILKPTVALYHDTRRIKKLNCYPLKLRVTYAREKRLYSLGIDITKDQFEFINNPALIKTIKSLNERDRIKEIKYTSDSFIVKATEIINKIPDFTFAIFERKFFQNELNREDVYAYYDVSISKMKKDGRVGTASSYQSSLTSLKNYSPKLRFRDVTVDFLDGYQKWLLSKGKSISTVGIYLRPLRAILNTAIEDGIISKETNYPFGRRKYEIPSSRNTKKALTKLEIQKIYQYQPISDTWFSKAKDMFLFSFMSNGMNMKDILLLKIKDVDGDYIRFSRAKTLNTHKSNVTPISFSLSPLQKEIISRWQIGKGEPNDYLFPVLSKGQSAEKQQAVIKQFTRMVNNYLYEICKQVGIDKKVTTYYARHSFATILKKAGKSIEMISESLGHSSVKTTSSYLDSFDDDTRMEISQTLIDCMK